MKMPLTISLICIVLSMLSIQFGASLAKQLFPILGSAGTSFLRLTLASVILAIVFKPWKKKLSLDSAKSFCLYGAALGLMNLFFYLSLEKIPLGLAVAFEFTGPLGLSLLKSRKKMDFLWVIIAVLGIFLLLPITSVQREFSASTMIGVFFALLAGIFWALYIITGQRISNQDHPGFVTAWGMFFATLFVLPYGAYNLNWTNLTPYLIGLAFFVGLLSSAIPYSLEMVALKNIPTHTFGILMSLEPAVASMMGYLNLHEKLLPSEIIGILLVIIASAGGVLTTTEKKI